MKSIFCDMLLVNSTTISDIQFLVWCSARWIGNHGFSIGIDDVQPSEKLHQQKQEKILEGYNKCDEKIKLYNEGNLPPEPGCDAAQSLEARITHILNGIRDAAGKVRLW